MVLTKRKYLTYLDKENIAKILVEDILTIQKRLTAPNKTDSFKISQLLSNKLNVTMVKKITTPKQSVEKRGFLTNFEYMISRINVIGSVEYYLVQAVIDIQERLPEDKKFNIDILINIYIKWFDIFMYSTVDVDLPF